MSSVKMFESISGECQTIFALENALKCLFYDKEAQGFWLYETKSWSKGRLLWKSLSNFLYLLISCKNLSFSRKGHPCFCCAATEHLHYKE